MGENILNVQNNSYIRFDSNEIAQRRNDKEFIEALVKNTESLVVKCAKSVYMTDEYTFEDKIQIGYMGLLKAVKKYENDKQVDFYTFAYRCITTELYNEYRGKKTAKRGYDEEKDSILFVDSLDKQVETSDNKESIVNTIQDENVDVFRDATGGVITGVQPLKKMLTDRQFKMFVDYYIIGKTLAEIAKETQLHITSVQRTLANIKQKVQQKYTEQEFAEMIGLAH